MLDLFASKSYIPNYTISKIIHETRADIRTQVPLSSQPEVPREASSQHFTKYLDPELMPGILTSKSPPPPFSFIFYRFCWQDTNYSWDVSFLAGSHGHWEFNLKALENISDDSGMEEKPSGSGWISCRKPSPCFIEARAGTSGVV